VFIIDSSNAQVVPGTRIAVYNVEMTALIAIGSSDELGKSSFNLDPGDYVLSATAPGYIFDVFDTIHVSGSEIDSVFGYRFDPGTPSMGDLCRVYGFIYGVDGQPLEGIDVTASLPDGPIRHNSTIISPYQSSTTTDSLGYFYLDLIPSDDLIPSGAEYTIIAVYPAGTILKKNIIVPASQSWLVSW
jgi:hypothetical protein